jgi:hypothetical protein
MSWQTLADRVTSWDGTCDYCGETYPPDTRILAVWSPTRFWIACRCSPQKCVVMESDQGQVDE